MFIDINFVLNVFNASNIVVFDKTNSVIVAIVDKMLRNPILLNERKINFRRIYDVDDDNKRSKVKSNMYSFNTALIRYLQAMIGLMNAERSICRLHGLKKRGPEI
jgi:hypothetical protein